MKIFNNISFVTQDLSRFSFGITSAIITSLALIVGLDQVSDPKMSIIGALMLLAIADNISDSLGIHIYRESQATGAENNARVYTISNFLTRLTVTLIFVLIVALLPIYYAVILSLTLGLMFLSLLSYMIAVHKKTNPYTEVIQHVGVAVAVITISHFMGQIIMTIFSTQ